MPNLKNSSPKDIQEAIRQREKREFAKLEKETKWKIFIVRYREQIFKYVKVGCIVLPILFLIIGGVVIYFKVIKKPPPPPPPPVDKPSANFKITVEKSKLLPSVEKENLYDAVARVKNIDPDWGVSKLKYKFILKNKDGEIVGEREQMTYILPEQEKYLIELNIKTEEKASSLEIILNHLEVQKLKKFVNPQTQFRVKNWGSGVFDKKTKAWAILFNESPFSFEKVNLNVILYDRNQEIVGVNYTNINAFTTKTERYFSVSWNEIIPTKVERIEVEPNVNVFEEGNFMNIYGTGQTLEY